MRRVGLIYVTELVQYKVITSPSIYIGVTCHPMGLADSVKDLRVEMIQGCATPIYRSSNELLRSMSYKIKYTYTNDS